MDPVVIRDTPVEHFTHILERNKKLNSGNEGPFSAEEIWAREDDKDFLFYQDREISGRLKAMKKGGMKNQYLGACLDYVRIGAMNACFWGPKAVKGLLGFIQDWMEVNEGNLIWSDKPVPAKLELPRIHHESCPRASGEEKHTSTYVDRAGKIRCAHVSERLLMPGDLQSFESFDTHSMLPCLSFSSYGPDEPHFNDDDYNEAGELMPWALREQEEYLAKKEEFDAGVPVRVIDPCLAIISEPKKMILPLEKILRRLRINEEWSRIYCPDPVKCLKPEHSHIDVCFGHNVINEHVGFPFCGWTLAWYVQKWYEQGQTKDGKTSAPVFMRPGERDCYRAIPDFRVVSSDD